jgi:hypothetical protein
VLRRLFLLLIAIWLPVQAGAALALSVTKGVAAPQAHEKKADSSAALWHDDMGHHDGHAAHGGDDGSSGRHDGHEHGADCERCGLCQFVHGGVMLNAAAHLPALPLPHFFRLPGEDRFAAHIPELPQRPPLTAA